MILYQNNIIQDGNNTTFLNRFALDDYMKLMNKIMENILSDLSKATGLNEQEIFEDYLMLNEFSPIREILKKEGKWFEEKSISSIILEKKCK